MIEFKNVTKYYPVKDQRRYILKNASFQIPTGTNVGILGGNGAGKSTLLRLIGGSEPPIQGRIVSDVDISWPLGLASGFQGSLTGRQNVKFVCEINGLTRVEIGNVMEFINEFSELGNYFDMPVKTYSSGMRARLTFGLSMSFKFDVYLIDELTSVGDMVFRAKAEKAFKELSERASLIFVSHNLKTLKNACESAIFLRDGRADYFPDIQDGIEAYISHVKEKKGEDAARKIAKQASGKKKVAKKVAK
ncbi:MAG: ABC transporter ATP-binding protein [Akkermansiaceae bacterium]